MLQRDEKHLKKNGEYSVDAIIYDCYIYATRCLLDRRADVSLLLRFCGCEMYSGWRTLREFSDFRDFCFHFREN
jgi:hypothetical protein